MEEMPEYFMLSKLPDLDPVTNFSPYYTQESFSLVMIGLSLAGIALYAMLTEPRLRVTACVVLFSAMCAAAYPVTGECMLPMEVAMLLCLAALFDLLGMFDANRKEGLRA